MGKPLARRGVLGCAPVVVGLAMSEREQEEGNSLIIQLGELHVQLIGARGLKGVARSSRRGSLGGLLAGPTSNPYCELRVQDERRRGKTAHRTLDPSWRREMFTFGIGVS
jgi:Ca2+-dependent lipid-binding protein